MANAAKKITKQIELYKLFKTGDDALHFHVNVDHGARGSVEPISVTVHDTETTEEITLAIDEEGVDEVMAILAKIKNVLQNNTNGVIQSSDPLEEYEEGQDEEENEDEDEDEEGEDEDDGA